MTLTTIVIRMIFMPVSLVMQQVNLNHSMQKKLGKCTTSSMIDSGIVCSIITKTLANKTLQSIPSAQWINSKCEKDLKTFSNEPIKVLVKIATTVFYEDWICEDACLAVVEGHKLIIGRDLFSSLGLVVVQQQAKRGKCVNSFCHSTCKANQANASSFPDLVSRIGLSKTHVVKSKFHQKFTAKHQKIRRVLIKIHPRVTAELDKQQKEGYFEKLSCCFDKNVISPIVIVV